VVRVLVAVERQLIGDGLAALLERAPGVETVRVESSGAGAMRAARDGEAQVCVLHEEFGLSVATRLMRQVQDCRVVLLADRLTPALVWSVLDAGVPGLVTSANSAADLVAAVRLVAVGATSFPPQAMAMATSPDAGPLTPRESEILAAVADGVEVKALARQLRLHVGTVRNHLTSAERKLGARTRIEAVGMAVRLGWIARVS
jgi:two-component system response regulator DesR